MTQEDEAPIFLVFQMAKVASLAWAEALKAALPSARVHHFHHLDPSTIARIDEQSLRRGETQNVKNLLWLRTPRGRPPPELVEKLANGPWTGPGPLRIVSGVRDPLDRAASLLFFCADFYGHRTLPLSFRQGASPEFLVEYFLKTWRTALAGHTPATTFEAILGQSFVDYRDWFSIELKGCLGVDVTSHPFDFDRFNLTFKLGDIHFFGYRFEDLDERRSEWQMVAAAASAFAGATIKSLPKVNSTEDRRGRELYRSFRQQLIVPDDLIDKIYSAPILRHFYRDAELANFKKRWRQRSSTQ